MKYELMLGDCLEQMQNIATGSVDCVFTSPPYNLREGMEDKGGFRAGHEKSAWAASSLGDGYDGHSDDMPYDEYKEWMRECLSEMWRVISPVGAIFFNHKPRVVKGRARLPFFSSDLPLRQVITWDRGSGFNHMPGAFKPVSEWILLYAKPGFRLRSRGAGAVGDVWRVPPDRGNAHPASFPVSLVSTAIEATDKRVWLDPFCGSGTTGVACARFGRDFVGVEKSVKYYEIAEDRISKAYAEALI